MINEVLYMESRLFREFCGRYHLSSVYANSLFNQHKIWHYIESCYDMIHTTGDEYILEDIEKMLLTQGVVL